jgi:hypothetical protein
LKESQWNGQRYHSKFLVQSQFLETKKVLTEFLREIAAYKTLILIIEDVCAILAFLKRRTLR